MHNILFIFLIIAFFLFLLTGIGLNGEERKDALENKQNNKGVSQISWVQKTPIRISPFLYFLAFLCVILLVILVLHYDV